MRLSIVGELAQSAELGFCPVTSRVDLLTTYYTKRTPITTTHFTPRNLCLAAGIFTEAE